MSSPEPETKPAASGFAALALAPEIARVLGDVGYESPSPIQAATIPPMLDGRDVLGQAQTGTGKTAAFALPILSRLDSMAGKPQALVLAPTRELAIQVAEAFQRYAAYLRDFRVLPLYGGQGYGPQLHGLRRGVHVVVGTPGRVVDHLKKGTLDLSALRFLVLDEADEMLRMGFAEDVDQVLAATPATRQVALFSATMPVQIRRIAQKHLKNPAEVTIAARTTTATNIRQRYWSVSGVHKLDALTRILEAEPFDAMLVFARTKQSTEELAGKLQARGFAAGAINGDIAQPQRERVIAQLKDSKLDILVATDVAARGLDVERISHVLNFDIPYDTESYVHRIGRTGRAGRSGDAILFVTPRERRMLYAIERATRQPITQMQLPSVDAVNDRRIERFMQRIGETLGAGDLKPFRELIERYEQEHDVPAVDIAAALAKLAHGDKPLLLEPPARQFSTAPSARERGTRPPAHDSRAPRKERPADRGAAPERAHRAKFDREMVDRKTVDRKTADQQTHRAPAAHSRGAATRPHTGEIGKQTYRLEVGHVHGIKPGNIIGAIANEAGLDSQYIGRLSILDDHSLIDLPEGMPRELLQHLKKVRVGGQPLAIHLQDGSADDTGARPRKGPPGKLSRPGGSKPPHRPKRK